MTHLRRFAPTAPAEWPWNGWPNAGGIAGRMSVEQVAEWRGMRTRATRWIYLPTRTAALREPDLPKGTFNAVAKADPETGHLTVHDFGNRLVGEAVFVPDTGRDAEDGGWLALYVFNLGSGTSDFVVLDAERVEDEPVAVVRMPQRTLIRVSSVTAIGAEQSPTPATRPTAKRVMRTRPRD
jgi:carotenoid cleavage dioxygenase-like enzyme